MGRALQFNRRTKAATKKPCKTKAGRAAAKKIDVDPVGMPIWEMPLRGRCRYPLWGWAKPSEDQMRMCGKECGEDVYCKEHADVCRQRPL
jgi:hypothetical protein